MDFDTRVKLSIYRAISGSGKAPTMAQIADTVGSPLNDVREAFERLGAKRLLVLESDTRQIRMAPPFSAVPTTFPVESAGMHYFANCVWDVLGVAAALHADIECRTGCGCCGDPMTLAVRGGAPVPTTGVAHFAVPAAQWWDDIVYS